MVARDLPRTQPHFEATSKMTLGTPVDSRARGILASSLFVSIGVAASFRDLQVSNVHVFSVLTALLLLTFLHNAQPLNRHSIPGVLLLLATVTALCMTVIGSRYLTSNFLWVQLVVLAGGACVIALRASAEEVALIAKGLLASITVSSAVAILQQFRVIPSSLFTDSSGLSRPTGLLGEPDWVGAYAAVALAILSRGLLRRGWVWRALLAINAAALLFSFARASWLAIACSFVLAYVATNAFRPRPLGPFSLRMNLSFLFAGLGAAIAVIALVPGLFETASTRLLSIFFEEHRDLNAVYRGQQLDGLISMARTAPWQGYGLSASGRVTILGAYNSGDGQNSVATNWVLGLLADGKLLALPFIALMVVLCVVRARTLGAQILAITLINSLFSNLLYSPIVWLAVGLAISADGSLAKNESRQRKFGQHLTHHGALVRTHA
jgi:O-antigen ligase